MLRSRCAAVLLAAAVMGATGQRIMADDFWVTAARGLQYLGWVPASQTVPYGAGDLGVFRNAIGDGWTAFTTRRLTDWEIYGGVAGFEFSPVNNQAVSLDTVLEVRKSLIPTARLRVATDATGTGQAAPLAYNFWVNTGLQDVRLEGTGSLEIQADINALGFYDVDAFISNRGILEFDGFIYADESTADFDVGPISLSGNIYADALAAITAPFFSSTSTANPLAVFSGRAKLQDQIKRRDELVARLDAGQPLTDDEMSEILTTSLLETVFGGGGSDLLEMTRQALKSAAKGKSSAISATTPSVIPEPASLSGWLVLAGAAGLRRRRR